MANLNYEVLTLNKEWNNSFTIFNKIIFSSHEVIKWKSENLPESRKSARVNLIKARTYALQKWEIIISFDKKYVSFEC